MASGPRNELEALWALPAAAPPAPGLSARLIAMAVHLAGGPVSASLLERARVDLELRHDGGAIDVWAYLRESEELEELDELEERAR